MITNYFPDMKNNLNENLNKLNKSSAFSSFSSINGGEIEYLGFSEISSRKPNRTLTFPDPKDGGSQRSVLSDIGQLELQMFRSVDSMFSPTKQRIQHQNQHPGSIRNDENMQNLSNKSLPSLPSNSDSFQIPRSLGSNINNNHRFVNNDKSNSRITLPSKIVEPDTQMELDLATFDLDGIVNSKISVVDIDSVSNSTLNTRINTPTSLTRLNSSSSNNNRSNDINHYSLSSINNSTNINGIISGELVLKFSNLQDFAAKVKAVDAEIQKLMNSSSNSDPSDLLLLHRRDSNINISFSSDSSSGSGSQSGITSFCRQDKFDNDEVQLLSYSNSNNNNILKNNNSFNNSGINNSSINNSSFNNTSFSSNTSFSGSNNFIGSQQRSGNNSNVNHMNNGGAFGAGNVRGLYNDDISYGSNNEGHWNDDIDVVRSGLPQINRNFNDNNGTGSSNFGGNSNFFSDDNIPLCQCGFPCKQFTSKKDTSAGQSFYKCGQQQQCAFFAWVDPNYQPVAKSFSDIPGSGNKKDPDFELSHQFGHRKFRDGQRECVYAAMENRDVFCLMPTGGGKSVVYQVPAWCCPGVAVVFSPLISLIQDQCEGLLAMGINAASLSSTNSADRISMIHQELASYCSNSCSKSENDRIKLLYVTPEGFAKGGRMMSTLLKLANHNLLSRFVIDEAHCVSQWGHDFRPDYLGLSRIRDSFPNVPIMCLTATANQHVVQDIIHIMKLKKNHYVHKQSFNRPNLSYSVHKKSDKNMAKSIMDIVKRFPKQSGIIYCLSRKDCETVSKELNKLPELRKKVSFYHAELSADERERRQTQWSKGEILLLCATIAFGMGINKPDVRYVIHHSLPKSLTNFYQESGRAGRDGDKAECILFYSAKDKISLTNMICKNDSSSVRDLGMKNLRSSLAYCINDVDCRRKQILQYFGEDFDSAMCRDTCDNCQRNKNVEITSLDLWDHAKCIFKLVRDISYTHRMKKLNLSKLIDLYCGSKAKGMAEYEEVLKNTMRGFEGLEKQPKDIIERLIYLMLTENILGIETVTINSKYGGVSEYIVPGPIEVVKRCDLEFGVNNHKFKLNIKKKAGASRKTFAEEEEEDEFPSEYNRSYGFDDSNFGNNDDANEELDVDSDVYPEDDDSYYSSSKTKGKQVAAAKKPSRMLPEHISAPSNSKAKASTTLSGNKSDKSTSGLSSKITLQSAKDMYKPIKSTASIPAKSNNKNNEVIVLDIAGSQSPIKKPADDSISYIHLSNESNPDKRVKSTTKQQPIISNKKVDNMSSFIQKRKPQYILDDEIESDGTNYSNDVDDLSNDDDDDFEGFERRNGSRKLQNIDKTRKKPKVIDESMISLTNGSQDSAVDLLKNSKLDKKQQIDLKAWLEQYRKRWASYWNFLSNANISHVISNIPCTLKDLEKLEGFGINKIRTDGEHILATLYAWLESRDLLDEYPNMSPPQIPEDPTWRDPFSDEAKAIYTGNNQNEKNESQSQSPAQRKDFNDGNIHEDFHNGGQTQIGSFFGAQRIGASASKSMNNNSSSIASNYQPYTLQNQYIENDRSMSPIITQPMTKRTEGVRNGMPLQAEIRKENVGHHSNNFMQNDIYENAETQLYQFHTQTQNPGMQSAAQANVPSGFKVNPSNIYSSMATSKKIPFIGQKVPVGAIQSSSPGDFNDKRSYMFNQEALDYEFD